MVFSLSVALFLHSHFPCSFWFKLDILVWALPPLGRHILDSELNDSAVCFWLPFTICSYYHWTYSIYYNYWINVLLPLPIEFKLFKGKIYVLARNAIAFPALAESLAIEDNLTHTCWVIEWSEWLASSAFLFIVQYHHFKRVQRPTPWLTAFSLRPCEVGHEAKCWL